MTFSAVASNTATIMNGSGAGSSGSVDLGGASRSFNVADGVQLLVGVPIVNGGLTKSGTGSMRLTAANIFAGDTVVSSGALLLGNGGTLPNSAHIIVSNSATFDVTAKAGGFVLGPGQTLAGNGLVIGRVTASGMVSPGASVGTLTFSTNLTLGGTTLMQVSRSGAQLTNDLILCNGTLTYGGTLVVTNTGSEAFVDGDTFQLFNSATNASAFSATNLPPLAEGFRWDTSGLGTGVVKVVYVGIGKPVFQSVAPGGLSMILSGTNGVAGAPYYLLSTTNVLMPISNWTRLLTNTYGPGGSFSNSVPIDPAEDARFFLLQTPN